MTEEVQAVESTQEAPNLQLGDLIVLFNLTQACAARGAIKADEMEIVGAVYTKLAKFLTAAGVGSTENTQTVVSTEA